ncbi:hypothetical protein DL96DRAFT_1622467 [Flagelloscypha sp. PMI_526]|nr:hypothetical protein DL96DRAFT_1622467 [Flagelloscypha sp. PMI_526]
MTFNSLFNPEALLTETPMEFPSVRLCEPFSLVFSFMASFRLSAYTKLAQEDPESELDDSSLPFDPPHRNGVSWNAPTWRLLALCSLTFNALCVMSFGFWILGIGRSHPSPLPDGQLFYSPANDVLEKIPIVFQSADPGISETKYQGSPSSELDALWEDLYGFGISKITAKEQSQMVNSTEKILVGGTPKYIVQLAVFHQLHCINMLRMKLSPDYYTGHGLMDNDHLSHCIDSLRQAVSCSADVTPLVWQWSEPHNRYMGRLNVVHSCRNFEAVQDWARLRAVIFEEGLNVTYRVPSEN